MAGRLLGFAYKRYFPILRLIVLVHTQIHTQCARAHTHTFYTHIHTHHARIHINISLCVFVQFVMYHTHGNSMYDYEYSSIPEKRKLFSLDQEDDRRVNVGSCVVFVCMHTIQDAAA